MQGHSFLPIEEVAMARLGLISVFLLLLAATFAAAQIYTWTDEDGVRHYSNQPPSDAGDPEVAFEEYQYDAQADRERFEMDQQEWDAFMQEVSAEEQEQREASEQRAREREQNRPISLAEKQATERERLKSRIAELEQMPLEHFGSQKNKRVRIGYFRYRLEALMKNPEKYFNSPGPEFEGNIKKPEEAVVGN
jgi:hypothetical protein